MRVKPWIGCLGLLLTIISYAGRAEPGLNGMAIYSELGNELFIAALYSEQTGTNAQELINSSYPKRIELKILSKTGITERQFSRLWRESIAINNDPNLLTEQVDNLIYFEGVIRDRLEINDHLIIDFAPTSGVSVSLNGIALGHVEDGAFFGLLLRSWIGLVPSSTKFRDDLLSVTMVDATLVNRFKHIYPRIARIEVAKQWKQASLVADDTHSDEPTSVTPAVIETEQKPATVNPPVIAVLNESINKSIDSKSNTEKRVASLTPVSEGNKPNKAAAANKTTTANKRIEKDDTRAQELLAKQFYMADVFKKIYSHVNYPKRAQELQQAGTVRLAVVIDAFGKLKTVEPVEESRFLLLNNAALAAVKKAAPFSPLPVGFNLTELEVSVPITFSLDSF